MLQAEFLTFKNFAVGEFSNKNEKISEIFLNSGKQKETKELEHLKTENGNKTLIIKSISENLSQLAKSSSEKSQQAKWYKNYKNNPPRRLYEYHWT